MWLLLLRLVARLVGTPPVVPVNPLAEVPALLLELPRMPATPRSDIFSRV